MRLRSLRSLDLLWLSPLLGFMLLTALLALHHEPWRDEADTWLYARDADALTIASRLRYMGSPGLWYAILFPFAKLGLPYGTQTVIHLALAWASATLFYVCAPLPLLVRGLLLFSYFPSFEYAVVARSYALGVLLLFTAAALYPFRMSRPLAFAAAIALLFHANAHSLGLAAALAATYAVELIVRRQHSFRRWVGVCLMAGSGALAAWTLLPPPDPANVPYAFPQAQAVPVAVGNAFLPLAPTHVGAWLGIGVLALSMLALAERPDALAFLVTGCLWLGYVFVTHHVGDVRHHGLYLVVAVAALWIGAHHPLMPGSPGPPLLVRAAHWALGVSLAASCATAAGVWRQEVTQPYSGAKELASFIRRNDLAGRTIAAHPAPHAEAVLPYLPGVRLWYLGIEDFGTYMLWDQAYRAGAELPLDRALERADRVPSGPDGALLLLSSPLSEQQARRYRLLHASAHVPFGHPDERFYLYAPSTDRR
jgi:hypothetical protein